MKRKASLPSNEKDPEVSASERAYNRPWNHTTMCISQWTHTLPCGVPVTVFDCCPPLGLRAFPSACSMNTAWLLATGYIGLGNAVR